MQAVTLSEIMHSDWTKAWTINLNGPCQLCRYTNMSAEQKGTVKHRFFELQN